jgi:hypothetical protein
VYKFMRNGAQHAMAAAVAASLCKKYDTTPRAIGRTDIAELQATVARVTGKDLRPRATVQEGVGR